MGLFIALLLPSLGFAQGSVGAIGDSISVGFNSGGIGNNREVSWSTGSDKGRVFSHSQRVESITGDSIESQNVAVAGARAHDLIKQIEKFNEVPDYVTITIGANDICKWDEDYHSQLTQFKTDVSDAVENILSRNPKAKVLFSPIPDMHTLWKVGKGNFSCRAAWDLFSLCDNLLSSFITDDRREVFRQSWEDANSALEDVMYENVESVKIDPELAYSEFEAEHISTVDCFHPSVKGQDLLAKMTWESGWFAD